MWRNGYARSRLKWIAREPFQTTQSVLIFSCSNRCLLTRAPHCSVPWATLIIPQCANSNWLPSPIIQINEGLHQNNHYVNTKEERWRWKSRDKLKSILYKQAADWLSKLCRKHRGWNNQPLLSFKDELKMTLVKVPFDGVWVLKLLLTIVRKAAFSLLRAFLSKPFGVVLTSASRSSVLTAVRCQVECQECHVFSMMLCEVFALELPCGIQNKGYSYLLRPLRSALFKAELNSKKQLL